MDPKPIKKVGHVVLKCQDLEKARDVQSARAHGEKIPRQTEGLSTAEENDLRESQFAFPDRQVIGLPQRRAPD